MSTTTPPVIRPFTVGDPETRSADLTRENVERLRALFPDAFTEEGIDFDVLRQLLGGAVAEREEKYGLTWHGKRQARQIALTPSTGTLLPRPEESVDWDTTQNLIIEGDNLEVLKLLQKSYAGKVKLIYIDPPYNTGKDFVYKDDYRDSLRNYLEVTGQVDGEGRRNTSNTEASGRFHTDWLNMMYPRLKLARSLLSDDGAIFISIDDNEVRNLRTLCDEIFGEENFIATVIWQKVFSPKNSAQYFSEDHDYVVVYAKRADIWRPRLLPRTAAMEARYSNPDNDPRGPWTSGDLSARNYYGSGTYQIQCPSGRVINGPPPGTYWRVSREKFLDMDADGRIWWGDNGDNTPRLKRYLSDVRDGKVPQTLWFYSEVGHTQESKKELLELLPFENSDDVFDTPKPTRLLRRILEIATTATDDDVVLDFFSGSGTTGQAVFAQNVADGGHRRFICVQLPMTLPTPARLTDGTQLATLADTTKERIRRAALKVREENALFEGDYGFRVFALASSSIRPWEPVPDDLERSLLDHAEHLVSGRTEEDILFELLLKLGLELTVPIEHRTIAGKTVHAVGAGALLVCLAEHIAREEVEALAGGIVAWHAELSPAGESQVVFRDSAFADDVAKTNLAAILQQHGLTNVRSL
jgi:adenine-specific DNA-methyltransferase